MRLVTFSEGGRIRIGVLDDSSVEDVSAADPRIPGDMTELLALGDTGLALVRSARAATPPRHALDNIRLGPPVPRPRKFLGIGANYPRPRTGGSVSGPIANDGNQIWFTKQVSSIVGSMDLIRLPPGTTHVIHEAELAIVIGRQCRAIGSGSANDYIAAYTVCNDVTVVDWIAGSPTMTLAKSYDTHGPTGPWLVTRDEIADPHRLEVTSTVNGEERQCGNTADMLFSCEEMVSYLSHRITLEPGDILTTGTPTRVETPLRAGDCVRCSIEAIGVLENIVVEDDAPTA